MALDNGNNNNNNTLTSGSSSDTTESENSINDYDKSGYLIDKRRNSLPVVVVGACSDSDINQKQYESPDYDFILNTEFLISHNNIKTINSKKKLINNGDDKSYYYNKSVEKMKNISVPVLVSSSINQSSNSSRNDKNFKKHFESYEQLVNNQRDDKYNFQFMHDHYMLPTTITTKNKNKTPTTTIEKRASLSLFNPDFLPNFNDMLAYVSNEENKTITKNNLSFSSSTMRQSFDPDDIQHFSRGNNYPTHQQINNQTTENFYASVVIPNTERESNTIEYNC